MKESKDRTRMSQLNHHSKDDMKMDHLDSL
jgi:hypothetical protein